MLFHLGHMFRIVSKREDAAVHFRVERFYPPIHHLREAGDLGNVPDGNFIVPQQRRRAAGGNDFDIQLRQGSGKLHDALLIGNADQGPLNPAHG